MSVVALLVVCASTTLAQDSFVLPEYVLHLTDQTSWNNSPTSTYGCETQFGRKASCLDPFLCRSNVPLPFLREEAEARGFELPLPLGVSVISTELDRSVGVSDLRVGIGNNPPESLERFSVGIMDIHASSQLARVDVWLLPFLNLYGVGGRTKSTGQVTATVHEFPFPNSPSFSFPIDVSLEGTTYGGGGTLAVGTHHFFATLDANYSKTDFTALDSKQKALVIAPRVGVIVKRPCFKGTFYVGAMYQDTAQTVELTVNPPAIGPIKVSVDQYEPDQWDNLIGMFWAIDERLHAMVEFGMGGRSYVISGLTVRF